MTRPEMAVTSSLPGTKALIKTAKYGIRFLELTEHKSLSEKALAVTGNRKYLLPPGSQSQTSDYYTICFLEHSVVRARCLEMRRFRVTETQALSDQSEKASRLTGTIFIPGMAANWFQQEAMVRHGQSDVRNRPGSGLRNQGLVCWEITVKSRKTEVARFLLKGRSKRERNSQQSCKL